MKKVVILVSEENDYICYVVELLIPNSTISTSTDDCDEAMCVIVDSQVNFNLLSEEQKKKAIVYSRESAFVISCVTNSINVILRSQDFYEQLHRILDKKK